jgi:hypothetical protein
LEYSFKGFQIAFFIFLYVSQIIESMKYLKSIDFAGQTIIWLGLLGGGLVILFSGESPESFLYIALIAQFFMGWWQMISSAVFMLIRARHFKSRSVHFLSGLICLGAIVLSAGADNELHTTITKTVLIITGVIIPWGLAIFYYTITWRWMFPARPSGKFLRHVSF